MENRKTIQGEEFTTEDKDATSLIFQFKKNRARMTYWDRATESNGVITKPFHQIFNSLNSRLLDIQSNIILPTGCIFRGTRSDGNEVFLIQDEPKIRSFRLSNTLAVKGLVSKMYDKFNAQTRVLKLNEVPPGKEEEITKEIALREKYLEKQRLQVYVDSKNHESMYKLFFRVFFPYTYVAIILNRKTQHNRSSFTFDTMKAAITLDPIKTLTDHLYQFPLANVSEGGRVCTGKLPLGDFGAINIKTFVEKMCGYFWNNRFNADISTGPQVYGDINFLGNWFEWEFKTYVDPTSILGLEFNDLNITKSRKTAGQFVYDKAEEHESFGIIDESILIKSFGPSNAIGGSTIDIHEGRGKKKMTGVAASIEVGGYTLSLGEIIKTKTKKFKISSFDGYKEYEVSGSDLKEKRCVVTDVTIIDEKRRSHHFSILKDVGLNFLKKSYEKAKNFVHSIKFKNGDIYESGQLVGRRIEGGFNSEANVQLDIISTIRERNGKYKISFSKNYSITTIEECGEEAQYMCPVDIIFVDGSGIILENNQPFSYRTEKVFTADKRAHPHIIGDYLSDLKPGILNVSDVSYKLHTERYGSSKHFIFLTYDLISDGVMVESKEIKIKMCSRKIGDDGIKIEVPIPRHIKPTSAEFETTVPTVSGSTLNIFGEHAYQIISPEETNANFKILRGPDGKSQISMLDPAISGSSDIMMFKPSIEHLKKSIVEVDGIKTFKVRDLLESGSELEYITFKVGDEVILSSDWDPKNDSISIKKIYDFITIKDRDKQGNLSLETGYMGSLAEKYEIYGKENGIDIRHDELPEHKNFYRGTLYAVIDDGSDDLSLYPLIDKNGIHYLNGISHAKKEYDGIKAGDFIKADVARIPYFAKKDVDEIVCFINMNGREMAIMKNGFTMWADIVKSHFKVFHRDKLTDSKISFYEEKCRQPLMRSFMVIYGDSYFGQIGVPLLTKYDEIPLDINVNDYRTDLYENNSKYELTSTLNLTKSSLAEFIEEQGSCHFDTFSGFDDLSMFRVTCNTAMSSYRIQFHKQLGQRNNSNVDIASGYNITNYDACYSIRNSSLNGGSPWMEAKELFYYPLYHRGWSYYNRPVDTKENWFKQSNVKFALAKFPAPRMLKKTAKNIESYDMFKLMGPQNRFYNKIPSNISIGNRRYMTKDELALRCVTNDSFLPKIEE